jgi:hypothetical protein
VKEPIKIDECPLCGNAHLYEAELKSVMILKALTMDSVHRKRTYTRLFVCPKTGGTFEAQFTSSAASAADIESVKLAD